MADFDRESMLEMFTFEMTQLIEQLELSIISGESGFSIDEINEIFRIMHTVKGSASMMMFDGIANVAHSMEDLFFYLREESPDNVDYSTLADLVLEGMDFIKGEISKIESRLDVDGDAEDIIINIKSFLSDLKGISQKQNSNDVSSSNSKTDNNVHVSSKQKSYKIHLFFNDTSEMENVRAFTIIHNLKDKIINVKHTPSDLLDQASAEIIKKDGFNINFDSEMTYDELLKVFEAVPFLKSIDIEQISASDKEGAKPANHSNHFILKLKYDEETEMQNVRSYVVIQNLGNSISNVTHEPKDLMDESAAEIIKISGVKIEFDTEMAYDELHQRLSSVPYLRTFEIIEGQEHVNNASSQPISEKVNNDDKPIHQTDLHKADQHIISNDVKPKDIKSDNKPAPKKSQTQHVISVNVSKLDQLVNFMGELVIAETMVTKNPELDNLQLDLFHKETRQLRKIINNLQDTVMSMRMVPLSPTFFKMNRLVRDMCKQLNKDVELEIIGDDTEVDKNIIEHISDPLMHIIRNSVDHGIEMPNVRKQNGKPEKGTVTLEAKNSGGDVLIIIKDDGAGINTQAVLEKAARNGLLKKPQNEYTEKEIHQFIFLPGFSTNENVTSYSGRGVGMDVVSTNLEVVGGTVIVDSVRGEGSIFTLKIPLTLAIIEGMTIKIGGEKYTMPIVSIKQSFKAKKEQLFIDPDGNEMISLRGEVYNVVRLYEFFNVETKIDDIEDGIMIMIEDSDRTLCVFADELIGEQQVVVKTMPKYINKIRGISGCTLIGNGDISLIIDVAGIFDK